MPDTNGTGVLPTPEPSTLIAVLFALLALILVAVVAEMLRRRAARQRQLNKEWRLVRDIAEEKGLSNGEWELLRGLIRRWSRLEPLRAVTVRQRFDGCVAEEIAALAARGDERRLEQIGLALRDVRVHLGLDYVPFGQRIQSTREISPGQHLWMAPAAQSPPRWARLSIASVDEAYFHATPHGAERDNMPKFSPGDTVRCRIWREDDARYVFMVSLFRVEEEPPTWVFRHAAELNRMQARAHYRVHYDQSVTVGVVNAPVDDDVENVAERPIITKLRGRVTSLSAGGFALVVQQPLPKQVLLRVTLELPGESPLDMNARIVSTAPISGGRHLIRASYVAATEEQRDVIARYVLQRQQPAVAAEQRSE
ncbi:MAG TPA: hypothetical protein HPP77_07210 [Candidatus Hydrogenedentes bacterium]|nr:hypothetical protein [Candidatus Hydrogenedentota bacterium]HIJ74681.1 hypothetical protein [Candidatus Hydrogenedentota bacterium]